MAKAKQKTGNGSPSDSKSGAPKDAIALLKADHRQVEEWFGEFEETDDRKRKEQLAKQICNALKIHTQIEEEIFYPAYLEATEDEDLHHEAEIEHHGAKRLIADIESKPGDEYFNARVTVLSEMIRHHVKEEEQPDGMFAKARKSEMDLVLVGEQLASMKQDLEANPSMLAKANKVFAAA